MSRFVHLAIVVALATEALYCAVMVLFVLRPEGFPPLPLGVHAADVPLEVIVERRLYAIEGWLAFVGLVIYLAVAGLSPAARSKARGSA